MTYLPSIVFGCAVNSAGSKMNRVLSTTRVTRSSLTGETVMLEDGSVSLFIWFFAGPSEWCCVRDLHHNAKDTLCLNRRSTNCYQSLPVANLPVTRSNVEGLLGCCHKVWSLVIWTTSTLSLDQTWLWF